MSTPFSRGEHRFHVGMPWVRCEPPNKGNLLLTADVQWKVRIPSWSEDRPGKFCPHIALQFLLERSRVWIDGIFSERWAWGQLG
jgi:hypothetical protein